MTLDHIKQIAERIELANHRRDYALARRLENQFGPQSHERIMVAAEVRRIAAERRQARNLA